VVGPAGRRGVPSKLMDDFVYAVVDCAAMIRPEPITQAEVAA
jgi:hypothetical protein